MLTAVERGRDTVSRIPGRGAITRSLCGLVLRLRRFVAYRAVTREEIAWGAHLIDHLEDALTEARMSPDVRSRLAAADRRAALSRKSRKVPGPAVVDHRGEGARHV